MLFFRKRFFGKSICVIFACFFLHFNAFSQCPQSYSWTEWSSFNGMNATGSVLVDNKVIGVTMTANYSFDSTETIFRLADYFAPFSGYSQIKDGTVPRMTWSVGQGGKTTICFSEPVTNPILLFASLGRPSAAVTLSFSEPYVPMFDGGGMDFLDGYSLSGNEGNCIILFPGTFSCVTINSTTPEYYTNITWGLQPPAFPVTITEKAAACGSTILTAQGGVSYRWNGGNNPQQASNLIDTSGIYTVTATDARGCTSVALKNISELPKATVTSEIEQTICQGQSYLGYTASGVYHDTLTNSKGCDSIRTVRLTVVDTPKLDLGGNREICEGESLEIVPAVQGTGPFTYRWSTGETSPNRTVDKAGKYRLTVGQGACSVSDSVQLTVNPRPVATPDETVCRNQPLVAGLADPNVSYRWVPSNETTREISAAHEGIYQVTLTNQFGCSTLKTFTVVGTCAALIFAPDAFSPNGDAVNDVFKVLITGGVPLSFTIFNRWGNPVYANQESETGWDGTLNDQPCAEGTYVYVLRYKNLLDNSIAEYRGSLLLMR
ncbi:gliding motility-associated C-terminal domain-containing protein [Salmonirosea aquatica]|uniref:T9SS type B sorting domain-containing protein n=1 Tax=Salmonirosea aquatica TaxID=2654236 RepID=A0A7C9F749_9BACT|nr:T9SS type B sorting domain-containing protein [Cytophagaceae bacterium SJW1-29]